MDDQPWPTGFTELRLPTERTDEVMNALDGGRCVCGHRELQLRGVWCEEERLLDEPFLREGHVPLRVLHHFNIE